MASLARGDRIGHGWFVLTDADQPVFVAAAGVRVRARCRRGHASEVPRSGDTYAERTLDVVTRLYETNPTCEHCQAGFRAVMEHIHES